MKRKRCAYDASFKLKVVQYAESNNNCAGVKMLGARVPAGTQHFSWELNIAS